LYNWDFLGFVWMFSFDLGPEGYQACECFVILMKKTTKNDDALILQQLVQGWFSDM